jgi:hypothetical protein
MSWRPKRGRIQPNQPYYTGDKRKVMLTTGTELSITLSHGVGVMIDALLTVIGSGNYARRKAATKIQPPSHTGRVSRGGYS